jgi:hypothetical protein
VVGDRGQVGVEVPSVEGLEAAADRSMQVEPLRSRKIVVEGLADELVNEREALRRHRVAHEEACPDRRVEDFQQPRRVQLARQLDDAQVELAPRDRGESKHGDRLRGEALDPVADERPHLLGHRQRQIRNIGRSEARATLHGKRLHHLTEEERVAARDPVNALDQRRTRLLPGEGVDVVGDIARREPAERDPPAAAYEAGESLRIGLHPRVLVAVGANDENPLARDGLAHEAEQEQRGRVGGVEVVDADQDRLLACGGDEEGRGAVEEAEPFGLGIDRALGRRSREPLEVAAGSPDHLDPRPIGGRAALLPAAPREDAAAPLGCDGRELLG